MNAVSQTNAILDTIRKSNEWGTCSRHSQTRRQGETNVGQRIYIGEYSTAHETNQGALLAQSDPYISCSCCMFVDNCPRNLPFTTNAKCEPMFDSQSFWPLRSTLAGRESSLWQRVCAAQKKRKQIHALLCCATGIRLCGY